MRLKTLLIREVIRRTAKKRLRLAPDVFSLRAELDRLKEGKPPRVYRERIDSEVLGGIRVEKVMPAFSNRMASVSSAIIYLHGGAWVVGAPEEFRGITTRLATMTGATVYAPSYRLAPEHPFPAGLDDCETVYETLCQQGIPPSRIVLAGDSAGGNLVFALALRLKRKQKPLPAALIGLSPCTDLTASGRSFKRNRWRDALLPAERLNDCIAAYCPGDDLHSPEISPLFGDLSHLPPVLLQVSNNEILLDDSVRMAKKIKASGGSVNLEIWKGLWHVWQVMPDKVPEAQRAIEGIARFIRSVWEADHPKEGSTSIK
ncbi:putative acetyl-hydrolase LipR [Halomonadaceae bacterium LMG 33818]|uniref:alpha/beta hydrolase n=1 Tax=Cernens ardua TaxID=3402176 RepID=UPI003EDBBC82